MADRHLYTVRQFCEAYPAFTEGGLRWEIFHEENNGLAESGAILRNGRKVLIDADAYFARLDAQNRRAAA